MLWEGATAQGHATDTQLLLSTHTQGNTSSGMGPLDAAAATAPAIPPHGSGVPWSHPVCTAVHTPWVCIQATLAHTHSIAPAAARRLHGCWAGKAAPLGSRQRILSPAALLFRRVLGGEVGQAPARAVIPGEPGARLPGRFPTAPRPSRFGRKRLIFLITLVLIHPRPRSCEQLHSRLALHT